MEARKIGIFSGLCMLLVKKMTIHTLWKREQIKINKHEKDDEKDDNDDGEDCVTYTYIYIYPLPLREKNIGSQKYWITCGFS